MVPKSAAVSSSRWLGGVSLTWTQLKLFFLEPQALRKVKNLIFVTGGGVTGCVQEESCDLPTLI